MTIVQTIQTEFLKLKRSHFFWSTFAAFALAPVMGGVFILIALDSHALAKAGMFAMKAEAMSFGANWISYLTILTQAVAIGGVLVFGFVASWIFGREYADGTAKDLLALPTSRTTILSAKFCVYAVWCLALVIVNLLIAFAIGFLLWLPAVETVAVLLLLKDYFITTLLTIIVGTPIAFIALCGKGYLAPLGFVALLLVLAQVIAAAGYGTYFPWSIPALYSGTSGEQREMLNIFSYSILILTGIAGYIATIIYWKTADLSK